MRYLANAVIDCDKVYRSSIVEIQADGTVEIRPFSAEEHSTIYVSGIILVARRDSVDESVTATLRAMVRRARLLEIAVRRVREYAASHHLYATRPDDEPIPVLLPRK